jgi:hypothetical protein
VQRAFAGVWAPLTFHPSNSNTNYFCCLAPIACWRDSRPYISTPSSARPIYFILFSFIVGYCRTSLFANDLKIRDGFHRYVGSIVNIGTDSVKDSSQTTQEGTGDLTHMFPETFLILVVEFSGWLCYGFPC